MSYHIQHLEKSLRHSSRRYDLWLKIIENILDGRNTITLLQQQTIVSRSALKTHLKFLVQCGVLSVDTIPRAHRYQWEEKYKITQKGYKVGKLLLDLFEALERK